MNPSIIQLASTGAPPKDPSQASVVIQLPMSNDFVDLKGKTITPTGVVISSVYPILGNNSAQFSGSSQYVTIGATTDMTFTGDYTIELHVVINARTPAPDIISNYTDNTSGDFILVLGGTGTFEWYPSTSAQFVQSAGAPALDVPIHLAMVRKANVCTLYTNGVASAATLTLSGTHGNATKVTRLGSRGGTSGYLNGAEGNLRVTNGVARYSANFTPPVGPYPTH